MSYKGHISDLAFWIGREKWLFPKLMMLFMIIFHQLSHIMFNIILCRSLDFAKIINSFSVQLCCQPSHLLLDESKVFFFHYNSCNCSMIGIDIVKSETKKKESNYCRFREYFNKLLVHLFICVPPCRTQKQIRSKNQKKKFF